MAKLKTRPTKSSELADVEAVVDATISLMVCSLLAPTVPVSRLGESVMERDAREFCEKIGKERRQAIGEIARLRPVVAVLLERSRIDSSPLFEIDLLICWSDREQASERARVFERCYLACARLLTLLEATAPRPTRLARSSLTDLQRSVWNCIAGKALLSKEIRRMLPGLPSDAAVRKHIQSIRAAGWDVRFVPQQGYVRPDAPPPG